MTAKAALLQRPALIATFFGPRGRMEPVANQLVGALELTPRVANEWFSSETETYLSRFDPPQAHDTAVVQLALNAPGQVRDAWETMRKRLANVLDDAALQGTWGYTLVYQAELASGPALDELVVDEMLPAPWRLDSTPGIAPRSLASLQVPGGRLWLMDVPIRGDGLQASTVYVALGPSDADNRLVSEVLLGQAGRVLMPDLNAHKGYHHRRRYRGGFHDRYREKKRATQETTSRVLEELRQERDATDELDELARDYGQLVNATIDLSDLHFALARNLTNYDLWRIQDGAVAFEFHRRHMDAALQDMELLQSEGQKTLEPAATAVDMMQAQLDKVQERRRQGTETLLAVLGVALAVPQLVDREAAGALLRWIGVSLPGDNILALLGVQLVITLVAMPLVGYLVWRIGAGRRG